MPKKLLLVSALLLGTIVYGRDFNPRKVVLNLATISDTHVNGYQTVPARKFRSALEQERDYEQIILPAGEFKVRFDGSCFERYRNAAEMQSQ